MSLALALAPHAPTSTATAYCPSCDSVRPSADFPATVEPDAVGAFLRCRTCARRERIARRFVADHRTAAKSDPSSPLAAQVRAARSVAAHNLRAAAEYADRSARSLRAVA